MLCRLGARAALRAPRYTARAFAAVPKNEKDFTAPSTVRPSSLPRARRAPPRRATLSASRSPQYGSAHPTRPDFRSGRDDTPENPNLRPQMLNRHRSNAEDLMKQVPVVKVRRPAATATTTAVSYTHLTLPTKRIV